MIYESTEVIASKLADGLVYKVNRMSFGRRLELMKRVRDIAPRLECFQAGNTQQDRIEARLLSAEIDQLYVKWGLAAVVGLNIDGRDADPISLAEAGPEDLFSEALACVKAVCELSGEERKN